MYIKRILELRFIREGNKFEDSLIFAVVLFGSISPPVHHLPKHATPREKNTER
jgi:hypothetical protein